MTEHLLGIEGLSGKDIMRYIDTARSFIEISDRDIKKVPALRGKTVINMFLEPSTRTRASFEIAGKRLSADTINIAGSGSSIVKGETLLDTARTLQSMAPDVIVMRHSESGAPLFLSKFLTDSSIVNAGDGMHEHPTQALLDCLTLSQHFADRPDGISNLKVAIVGDIWHSRVARSNVWAHAALGNEIRLIAPPTLMPPQLADENCFGTRVSLHHRLREGLEGVDVVMVLRMQLERQNSNFVPSLEEYTDEYCISERVLRDVAPDAIVLHPGPANRGIEISGEVLDGPRSLATQQVRYGVAVRMAVLFLLATAQREEEE